MTQRTSPTPTLQRLVAYLTDAREPDPASAEIVAWLASSPRFRAFVEANRDKVRKKLRGATSTDARLDVGAELRVAALLLADRRFDVAFEAYGAGRRGPDYTITFRAGRAFNVEVTRRHGSGQVALEPAILAKLRQLPPSAPNVLVVVVGGGGPPPDPDPVLRGLRARADRRDDASFTAFGLGGSAAFHAGLQRLSAVVVVSADAADPARVTHWWNAGARIQLPATTLRPLLAALAGYAAGGPPGRAEEPPT